MILKELLKIDGISEYIPEASHVVYFLISDGEVVYVGQTQNLSPRVSIHCRTKKFDRIFFLRFSDPSEAKAYETAMIRRIRPVYCGENFHPKKHPRHGPEFRRLRIASGFSQSQLGAMIGVTAYTISRWENGHGYPDKPNFPKLKQAIGFNETINV